MHSKKAVEGPFAMELNNWKLGLDALVGYDVLAGIIAFCRAIP